MSTIEVKNTLYTHEEDYGGDAEQIVIKSHCDDNALVRLIIYGVAYTLNAADIITAVENATRTN